MIAKIIAAFAVLAIIAGGWFYYQKYQMPSASAPEESEWIPSASFVCEDNTQFTAEFPSDDQVRITVGGTPQTLSRTSGAGLRFESAQFTFIFAGEEVAVISKSNNAVTNCTQPFDANNAPVNFGDAGEGEGEQQDVGMIVKESLLGTWKSDEDMKFIREFRADGTAIDVHDGKTVSTGTWQVFTAAKPLDVSFPLEENAVYIQLRMSGSQSTALNFKLTSITPEKLELVYMDRGGALSFTRAQ